VIPIVPDREGAGKILWGGSWGVWRKVGWDVVLWGGFGLAFVD